jgi:hypothetical protein
MNMSGMDAGGARGQTPGGHMGEGDPGMPAIKPPDVAPGTSPSREPGMVEGQFRENALSASLTDGTTPLKYSAFLAAASNNHQIAFQNAIKAIYARTGAYNKVLDLEGATVLLTGPVTAPTGDAASFGARSIINGEIRAQAGFSGGDYMLNIMGEIPSHYLRLVNVTFNGQNKACWIRWDIGNMIIQTCQFKNPKPGDTVATIPGGLYCKDGGVGGSADAGFWIDNCWFSTDEGAKQPSSRMTIGILSETGDNKLGGLTTMSYFRHCFVSHGGTFMVNGLHVFQGVTTGGSGAAENMTDHTASIKVTGGRSRSIISNLYLGKSFLELSNESNPTAEYIGQIAITNMFAFMENGQQDAAAHIVARNYAPSGTTTTVKNVSITNSLFVNGGREQANPTKIFNPAGFDRDSYQGIRLVDNNFDFGDVQPQANPVTLKKTFGSQTTSHNIDYTDFLPFSGRPKQVLAVVGNRTGGTHQALAQGKISADTVDIETASPWAGDITATVTVNNPQSSGFLDG